MDTTYITGESNMTYEMENKSKKKLLRNGVDEQKTKDHCSPS